MTALKSQKFKLKLKYYRKSEFMEPGHGNLTK